MRVLVASQRHGLLPFAWRLKREGHDVESLVWSNRYEKAWEGMFAKALSGQEKNRETQTTLGDLARAGEFIVMTDSERGDRVFSGAPNLYGFIESDPGAPLSPLAVGGWFDGEQVVDHLTHLLVRDVGLWTGGLGPGLVGGATLIKASALAERVRAQLGHLVRSRTDEMKSAGFKGLFSVDVVAASGRELHGGALLGGWQPVHAHAFVSEVSNLGQLMEGGSAPVLQANYVVVVPVTVPPFPHAGHSAETRVEGLDPADTRSIFFHDFFLKGEREIWVAGLDGLVAVVRGSGHHFPTAQAAAYRVAGKMQVPGKQYRLDVGSRVGEVLAGLETL